MKLAAVGLATLIALVALPLAAQQADVLRGRVTGADNQPIDGARIKVTSIPGNVTREARADRNGRFGVTFASGEGDYWVDVGALGYASKRFEVKRLADEDVLIADAKLVPTAAVLSSVQIQGDRERAKRNENADISGTEKSVGVAAGDPSQAGNLAAMAASLPGVQLIPGSNGSPDQFSVFGLGGDQNSGSLNGLGFGGGEVPRDAATRGSLSTSPWDVSRGGFSGAEIAIRTMSGSNFSSRAMSTLGTAPSLAWTDRTGRALRSEYNSLSLGGATAGPLAMDRVFYSAGYQFDRRVTPALNFLQSGDDALFAAGVAADSARRFRDLIARAQLPLQAIGQGRDRVNDRASFLASLDFAPASATSGQSWNITTTGSFARSESVLGRLTALPSDDVGGISAFGSAQLRQTSYFGVGVLSETSVGLSGSLNRSSPYAALPEAVVRVNSTLADGQRAVSQLTFGGNPAQAQRVATQRLNMQNQLSWFSANNEHRLKLGTELRYDRFGQDFTSNSLGTFQYNSLADFEAGRPASFSRALASRVRAAGEIAGALSLGDSYRPTPDLQIQFGVRLDANRYLTKPVENSAIEQAFGVRNDVTPNRVELSPRVGFAWTYGQAGQIPVGSGFMRAPRAVVRGGIGVFQSAAAVQLIGNALTNTGAVDGAQQLVCVGSAVPAPEWNRYTTDLGAIPSRCADGTVGGAFSNALPPVSLIDADYRLPRSLRANLNWTGLLAGSRLAANVDLTVSRTTQMQGFYDLNFTGVPRFSLADEANRPIYAAAASIVPGTGAVAGSDSRRSNSFGMVAASRSNLSANNSQLTVSLAPSTFSSRFGWSLAWVYSSTRDRVAGFASTSGDPRFIEEGRASLDSQQQLVYSLSYNFFDWFPVSWSGSLRAGRPYTPMVSGDLNGDGFPNDRAFVYSPSSAADPALASSMQALLASAPAGARRCLQAQLGALAARNSCQGPWQATSTLTVALNPVKFRLPQRTSVSFYLNNALGAFDLMLNGQNSLKGWGQVGSPDQALLYVRGFDASARRFRYDVNQRFGTPLGDRALARNPVVLTAQVRVDLGYTRERQLLTQSLDRGRTRGGTKAGEQDLRSMGGALLPLNPMTVILQQADTLHLTRVQADSIAMLNRRYSERFTTIWTPIAEYLAALPTAYDEAEAYARYRRGREQSVDALLEVAPAVQRLLNAEQRRALPAQALSSLDVTYLRSIRSSTAGGAGLGALGMLAQLGWAGGSVDASGGSQAVMIHR